MSTLAPCPFCGDETEQAVVEVNVDTYQNDVTNDYAVRCENCGAFGPWHCKKDGARTEWNARAGVEITAGGAR